MSETSKHNHPYHVLGSRLKQMREKLHESIAEVSGAVEIEPDMLTRIERGERCPAEDVLMLLISYFNFQEDEAERLWELAGYDKQTMNADTPSAPEVDQQIKPMVMLVQQDNRIVYTDMVNVTINNHGVVMNFMQTQGTGDGQPNVIARMGMSRDHAKSVMQVLKDTLEHTEPRQKFLPPPHRSDDSQLA